MPAPAPRPAVSVVMALRNGASHVEAASRSVLGQTLRDLELVVVDDASEDGGATLVAALVASDPRVRLLRADRPAGPAAARNAALAAARGEWIAVVDSDDLIVPERLSVLLAAASRTGADIVADDQIAFRHGDLARRPWRMLSPRRELWIGAEDLLASDRWLGSRPSYGFLKPIFRAEAFSGARPVRYNDALRIGEDFDLLLRLVLAGRRLLLLPEAGYLYRRHGASTSHRFPADGFGALRRADAAIRDGFSVRPGSALARAMDARLERIADAETAMAAVGDLRRGRLAAAAAALARRPSAAHLTATTLVGAAARRLQGALTSGGGRARRAAERAGRPVLAVVSRQRLEPSANGSSAYLVSLCSELRRGGFEVRLVVPSASMFGRRPVLPLRPLRRAFDSVEVNGGLRLGSFVVAREPRVTLSAVRGLVARAARRFGLTALASWDRPAAYAIGQPWTAEELAFVAHRCAGAVDLALADYAFTAPVLPFVQPRAGGRGIILMHDLLSLRRERFREAGEADSVVTLGRDDEGALLGRADIVIAIQDEEAAEVRRLVPPTTRVVTASMPVEPAAERAEGSGDGVVLFVGGASRPNVHGILWFIREAWPAVRRARPEARLQVVGRVCDAVSPHGPWEAVDLLGQVDDLAPKLHAADVVVCPLRLGSGLKIKLVEALAAGKAVVATTVAAEGVNAPAGTFALADEAAGFGDAVASLLSDSGARARLAERALRFARATYSPGPATADAVVALRALLVPAPVPARQERIREDAA